MYTGPNIITNGLVLCLDAANRLSYPGSGTTWSDLSGFGNTGTLTNGPTFNSGNGGSIVFDGSNDYVTIPNGYTNIMKNNNNWTVSFWFKASNLANSPVLLGPEVGQLSYFDLILEVGSNAIYFSAGGGSIANYLQNTSTPIVINTIYNVVFIKTGTTTGKVYVNGNEIALSTVGSGLKAMPDTTADFRLGAFNQGSFYLNGNIYNTSMYNRSLSSTEVQQNYEAVKTRFGL